jgi:hypothetical protein
VVEVGFRIRRVHPDGPQRQRHIVKPCIAKLVSFRHGIHHALWRVWPALIAVSLPLAVSFGIYAFSVDHLIKDIHNESWRTLRNVALNPDAADQLMRDVGGRIQFGIASGVMRTAAAAATALAIIVLARRIGSTAAISIAAILVTMCTAFYFTALTLEQPHAFAGKSRLVIGYIYEAARPGGFKNIDQAIRLNILVDQI